MTELNIPVENISKEELETENINLKTHIKTLLKKNEEFEQQLYETNRQLATSKLMEEELNSEIEALQNNGLSGSEQLLKQITNLEEDISIIKQVNSDRTNELELEITEKNGEIDSLRNKLKDLSQAPIDKSKDQRIEKLIEESYELKSKNDSLVYQLEEQQIKIKDMIKENHSYENKNIELKKEVEELQEYVTIHREELKAWNERFTNLQDEYDVAQRELNEFKNNPQDHNKKGNSLFAEVEDNRQHLKKMVQQTKQKYAELRISHSNKMAEIHKIRAAYEALKTQIEEDNTVGNDQTYLIKSLEDSIQLLKNNVKGLQNELILRKEATNKILNGQHRSNEALIEITRKEVMELRSQLEQQLCQRLASEKSWYDATAELKTWRQQARSLKAENLILIQEIDELKIKFTNSQNEISIKLQEIENLHKEMKTAAIKKESTQVHVGNTQIQEPIKPTYEIPSVSKSEIVKFCNLRTLTVDNSSMSISPECTKLKDNVPNLSSSSIMDISFENFDGDLTLSNPLPENNTSLVILDNSLLAETNKENIKINQDPPNKLKRKVCFADDAEDEHKKKNEVRPKGGRILVPKKKIVLVSKKN